MALFKQILELRSTFFQLMSCSDAALNKDVIGGIVKVSMISYHFELSNDVKKDPVNLVCFR